MYLHELVTPEELNELYQTVQLRYIQTNGTPELKAAICQLYPGATPDNVLVTNGSAEANFITLWRHLEPGDEMVALYPNYLQVPGIARNFGATVTPVYLKESLGWAPDLDEFEAAVTPKTSLIYITNPNNPTGAVLTQAEMERIVAIADKVGAWILADEVYRGAELDGDLSPSFWGMYDKVLIVSGLSKAYTLPGLRMGWLIGPPSVAENAWGYHDYTTITTGALNDRLAQLAMRPETRRKILQRNRDISARNLETLTDWLASHAGMFRFIPPQIGGVAFIGYNRPINSTDLVLKLLHEQSVLIVPGDAFGVDGYVRVGYGAHNLKPGLGLINNTLQTLTDMEE
ncbi:MAG: aminotransferase class I/II-fold pyridoxal phosphate-dependent enzyme [Chloroflexota bacterium]